MRVHRLTHYPSGVGVLSAQLEERKAGHTSDKKWVMMEEYQQSVLNTAS